MTWPLLFQIQRKPSYALACKGPNGRKIKVADCMCYATLLCRQGKKVLKCPRIGCHGWKVFEQQSSSDATYKVWDPTYKLTIICNVCGFRGYIPKWTCYQCAMPQSHCFCEIPKTAKTQSARKRPAAALPSQVMPATKRTAT